MSYSVAGLDRGQAKTHLIFRLVVSVAFGTVRDEVCSGRERCPRKGQVAEGSMSDG